MTITKKHVLYKHSLYNTGIPRFLDTVNVGIHKKDAESENRVNQGSSVALKGRKIG
jgi:hypothetical protein